MSNSDVPRTDDESVSEWEKRLTLLLMSPFLMAISLIALPHIAIPAAAVGILVAGLIFYPSETASVFSQAYEYIEEYMLELPKVDWYGYGRMAGAILVATTITGLAIYVYIRYYSDLSFLDVETEDLENAK